MTTEFNELLQRSPEEAAQIWIIGSRGQVTHLINEMYVKQVVPDRVQFTPVISVPFAPGKFMAILLR